MEQAIPLLREQIARLFSSSPEGAGLRSVLAWHRSITRLLGLFLCIKKALARHQQPLLHLQFVAQHALDLIRYDFRENGITRAAYSFREKTIKSDLNSPAFQEDAFPSLSESPHSFLTPRQWAILEPLLPSPNASSIWGGDGGGASPLQMCTSFGDREASRSIPVGRVPERVSRSEVKGGPGVRLGRGRGRPPADPRPLLDVIFWKIAHHARWQDLPAGSPPMLTCRRYYRRLFLSGRLLTLYTALYKDLRSRGQADLTDLVNQGCFTILGNELILHPAFDETWQLRTALLFMQQGWQVSRRILHEKEHEQPRSFPQFRYNSSLL